MIWFGWVLWHINPCRLFNAKSSLNIYIKYIWLVNTFSRVRFFCAQLNGFVFFWFRINCLIYSISTLFRSFNAELSHFHKSLFVSMSSYLQIFQLNVKTVLFPTIQFRISTQFFVYTHYNVKTVLFQTIQFSISTQFISIWPIDRTLSGFATPG